MDPLHLLLVIILFVFIVKVFWPVLIGIIGGFIGIVGGLFGIFTGLISAIFGVFAFALFPLMIVGLPVLIIVLLLRNNRTG